MAKETIEHLYIDPNTLEIKDRSIPPPNVVVNDRRSSSGYKKPEVEVHGKVAGFIPAGDYILVRRLAPIEVDGMIVRPEVAVELSERGVIVAVSNKAGVEGFTAGTIAKFSKYGAEEINFDDAGQDRYALVRTYDVRGWHGRG